MARAQAAHEALQPRLAQLQEIWSPPRGCSAWPGEGPNAAQLGWEAGGEVDGAAPWATRFVAAEGAVWELAGCAGAAVRAAHLQHRVPCWGFVFREAAPCEPGAAQRKVRPQH